MISVNLHGVILNVLVILIGRLVLMQLFNNKINVVIWKIKMHYGKQEIVMLRMTLFAKYRKVLKTKH